MHLDPLTAGHAHTARRLLDLHEREVDVLRPDCCWWCGKPRPCPDVRWSRHVLEQQARTAQ